MTKNTDTKLTRLYPTGDYYIPGVPAIEQDVDPLTAKRLLAYRPPAFTTDPPDEPAAKSTGPADAGSSDSKE